MVNVPDPTCIGIGCNNTVTRNFSFGPATSPGVVTLNVNGTVYNLDLVGANPWTAARIRCRLPASITSPVTGQLMVTRGDNGKTTPIGVTFTYDPNTSKVRYVTPTDFSLTPLATPIQDAIDAAAPGDLILIPDSPWDYNENPILWKPVRLQGAGLGTVINANPNPAERLQFWHAKVTTILGGDPFTANEAPGVLVLGRADFANPAYAARIDGLQIKGAIAGGGIQVFAQATNLRISNNRIMGNPGQPSQAASPSASKANRAWFTAMPT